MTTIEQSLLNDYKRRYDLCYAVCFEFRDDESGDLYKAALKKAAGLKMIIDYMELKKGTLNPNPDVN